MHRSRRLIAAHLRRSRLVVQRQPFFSMQPICKLFPYVPALALQQHPDLALPIPHSNLGDLSNPQPKSGLRFTPALVSKSRFCDHGGVARPSLTHSIRAAQVVHHWVAARGL